MYPDTSIRERSGSAIAIGGTSYPEDHVEGTVDWAPEELGAASSAACHDVFPSGLQHVLSGIPPAAALGSPLSETSTKVS
jgi:hypothetical protein